MQLWENVAEEDDHVRPESRFHVPFEALQEKVHHGDCAVCVLATVKG